MSVAKEDRFENDGVLVLVFQAVDPKKVKAKTPASSSDVQAAVEEHEGVVARLRGAGLHTSTRNGSSKKGELLIFVRPSLAAVAEAAAAERTNDYLHGVRSKAEAPVSLSRTSSLPKTPLASVSSPTVADRLRYTHDLVTAPPCHDTSKAWHTISGAGIGIKSKEFPHVIDMLALHDEDFNKKWLKRWTSPDTMFRLRVEDLDAIRDHFGEQIGLYFGFLIFYFNGLLPMALWGLAFWATGRPYDAVYSMGVVTWACLFVEAWRIRERKLAVRWGCSGITAAERVRKEFKPHHVRRDPVTGEEQEVFEWWRKELRMGLALPIMALFAALLGAVMTTMFVLEVFVAKIYTGPGKALVPLAPTALFTVAVPQILAAWQATASRLTSFENHKTERTFSSALTLKMFALQAFVAYGALTLSAFVYIPWGQSLMDSLVDAGFFASNISHAVQSGQLKYNATGRIHFDVNPNRMHTQLFAVSVTSQAINAFTELGLPIILRKVAEYRAKNGSSDKKEKAGSTVTTSVLRQLALPPYEIFTDYAEMATQFGYITLWSVIWPLSPVMGFVNNFFEIRSDAAKICLNTRRPIPARAESIGPWLEVMGFIAWLAAMVNAALLYLYERASTFDQPGVTPYSTVMRQHGAVTVNGTVTSSPFSLAGLLPIDSGISPHGSALLVAFLVATASEHGYALFRSAARHVLQRAIWRSSPESQTLERSDWQSRRTMLQLFERKGRDMTPHQEKESLSSFWTENDTGKQLIQDVAKMD